MFSLFQFHVFSCLNVVFESFIFYHTSCFVFVVVCGVCVLYGVSRTLFREEKMLVRTLNSGLISLYFVSSYLCLRLSIYQSLRLSASPSLRLSVFLWLSLSLFVFVMSMRKCVCIRVRVNVDLYASLCLRPWLLFCRVLSVSVFSFLAIFLGACSWWSLQGCELVGVLCFLLTF